MLYWQGVHSRGFGAEAPLAFVWPRCRWLHVSPPECRFSSIDRHSRDSCIAQSLWVYRRHLCPCCPPASFQRYVLTSPGRYRFPNHPDRSHRWWSCTTQRTPSSLWSRCRGNQYSVYPDYLHQRDLRSDMESWCYHPTTGLLCRLCVSRWVF